VSDALKRLLAVAELQDTLTRYWSEVDHNAGREAANFFTKDCTGFIGPTRITCRRDIENYYATKSANYRAKVALSRVGRHCCANLQTRLTHSSRASLTFTLVSHAGFGELPIIGDTTPVSVSDAQIEFEHQDDGRWLIVQYRVSPLLVKSTQ
jgi:hypothetical protein